MATPRRRSPGVRHSQLPQPRPLATAAVVAALGLSACVGERATFQDETLAERPHPASDQILDRLALTPSAVFTAEYEILTRLGEVQSTATVVQAEGGRRSVTINDVRYLDTDSGELTCDLSAGTCEDEINNARTSDVFVFDEFYGDDFATRLDVDTNRRAGEPTTYAITQGGEQALCVDVPVTGGTNSYCAIETGPLVRYNGNDLFIEMVRYSPTADESKFSTTR